MLKQPGGYLLNLWALMPDCNYFHLNVKAMPAIDTKSLGQADFADNLYCTKIVLFVSFVLYMVSKILWIGKKFWHKHICCMKMFDL